MVEDLVDGGRLPLGDPVGARGVVVAYGDFNAVGCIGPDITEFTTIEGLVQMRPGEEPRLLSGVQEHIRELNSAAGKLLPGVRIMPYQSSASERENELWIYGMLPVNTPRLRTLELTRHLSDRLGDPVRNKNRVHFPEVDRVVSHAGDLQEAPLLFSPFALRPSNQVQFFLGLRSGANFLTVPDGNRPRPRTQAELLEEVTGMLLQDAPGVSWMVTATRPEEAPPTFPGVAADHLLTIVGPDLHELERCGGLVRTALSAEPGVVNAASYPLLDGSHLDFQIDLDKCKHWGVSAADVSNTLQTALGPKTISSMVEGERVFDIAVRWPHRWRDNNDAILDLPIDIIDNRVDIPPKQPAKNPVPSGGLIDTSNPLNAVPRLRLRDVLAPIDKDGKPTADGSFVHSGAVAIYRENGNRALPVRFGVRGRPLAEVQAEAAQWLAQIVMPPYRIAWTDAETEKDAPPKNVEPAKKDALGAVEIFKDKNGFCYRVVNAQGQTIAMPAANQHWETREEVVRAIDEVKEMLNKAKLVTVPAQESTRLKVELAKDRPHTLIVPEDVRIALGIRKGGKDVKFAVAALPKEGRPLVLSASTAFDPVRLYRIRTPFTPADVVKITKFRFPDDNGVMRERELRPGDEVKAGDVLAELYSVDLSAKKNDLIDALVQHKYDKEVLDKAMMGNAIPRALIEQFEKAVQADANAIQKTVRHLEASKVPAAEIEEVYQAAEEIFKKAKKREANDKKYVPNPADKWGKIILKAPVDAVIVERNLSEKETLLEPSINLFQLAQVDKLQVLANAPEEKIKELLQVWKKTGLEWTIRPLGLPDVDGIAGPINEIGYLADPNTHTVPIKGMLSNKEGFLRAGQLVTATIALPPPRNVVEIPASAVLDQGKQSIVFIQPDATKAEFTMRRVLVTQRFDNKALVRSVLSDLDRKLTPEEEETGMLPKEPLLLGERVVTAGLLELKKVLEDREADTDH